MGILPRPSACCVKHLATYSVATQCGGDLQDCCGGKYCHQGQG